MAVAVGAAPQAAKVLATEPPPCLLQKDKAWVGRGLEVGVLRVILSAVLVDDPAEGILVRWPRREAADP